MRITSFNANGIRSAAQKGFFDWFLTQGVDVLCVQETKAQISQLQDAVFHPAGYERFFCDAQTKKGYSGVAIYCKQKPDRILTEMGVPELDQEGRYIEAQFGTLSIVSLYIPSGSSGELRQEFKFRALDSLGVLFDKFRKQKRDYIICGDFNIVHTEKDIKNWRSNQKNSGCLPEERAWLDWLFHERGWVDTYRRLRPEGTEYTWWSNRGQARQKDVGWRIDYQITSSRLQDKLRDCAIHPTPRFSDHAPYTVDYAL